MVLLQSAVAPAENVLAFAAVAAVIIAVPGPSVLFVISRALILGRRAALLTVVGNSAGILLQVIAVATGVGALAQRSVLAFNVIKFAGAAHLVYLGVQTLRHRTSLAGLGGELLPQRRSGRVIREGFFVGLTNPKNIVFFTAVLPQFVDRSAGGASVQLLVLGVVFLLIALILDSLWAVGAGTGRVWLARSPRQLSRLNGLGGVVMVGLGARLAFTGRSD